MTISDLTRKGRSITTKAVVAYKAYEKGMTTARMVADKICHTLVIEQDYQWDLHEVAVKVAQDHTVRLPTTRLKKSSRAELSVSYFRAENWTPLNIPGMSRLLQVRATRGDTIEFRSPRAIDTEILRNYLDDRVDEMEKEDPILSLENYKPKTQIMSWGKDGWEFRKERPSRSFGSVFLPSALQSDIESDLKRFTESRERLQKLELPWRRGYLLAGPPGTGKTSLSLAIAGSLGFSLASLSLTDIESDGMLRQAVGQLRGKTVLVIEDIDAYSVSHDRDHNASRDGALSLSGLLNSLDGFETPDGLVTIATTNHVEHLDPALVRSGRLDRTFTLDHIEARELERLFAWFYEEPVPSPAPAGTASARIAPSEVAEIFKQHLEDPAGGWEAINARINETQTARLVAA